MGRKVIVTSLFFALLSFSVPVTVSADTPAPARDYTVVSGDGQFIFVMLARWGDSPRGVRENQELREKYAQSGLYKNDGSTIPLWTVGWYAFNIDISSDGRHLVRWGPWPMHYSELAVAFYDKDQELASYRINQLVREPARLPHTVSHFQWGGRVSFDDAQGRVTVGTLNGEVYEFDVATGKIISSILPTVDPAQPVPTIRADIFTQSIRTAVPTRGPSDSDTASGTVLLSGLVSLASLVIVLASASFLRGRKKHN